MVNNGRITSDEVEVANTLNNFFSNIKNLKFEYYVEDKLPHSLSSHPTLNTILEYKNHPSSVVALWPGVVACTCNPATLEAEFRNGVGSIPVGVNSPSIGGWIV